MSGKEEPPSMTRAGSLLALVVIMATALAGLITVQAWPAIVVGTVVLLFSSDRGQHRWLADRFPHRSRGDIVALSVVAHVLNNLFFMVLAFIVGRVTRLLWWDVFDGVAGAWGELALWLGGALVVIGVGEAAWRWLERAGRR